MDHAITSRFREIGSEREGEFYSKGYKRSYFFPHRIYYLPKCGPDGFRLAEAMCGPCEPIELCEVVIYADPSVTAEFPPQLFFDDNLIWHQQQFGRPGQIATANLVVKRNGLYSMVHVSDLVQRISRRREHKTRIENRFKGWGHMLLNATVNFANENNLPYVFTPTADLALKNTDPSRHPKRALFERIYDRNVNQLFKAHRSGEWWAIVMDENR